jgi:hypothetical protein
MRLTLRYLLAYLDDYTLPQGAPKILQTEDSEAIGRKIQESDFAKGLVQRIRDVMRRVRLGAPSESEPDAGLDPNTVAEYLDHTLPDVRVPDFEKVCLESDPHLAEVACCHQILALVLREPAEVDEDARRRLYELPGAIAAATLESEPVIPAEVPEDPDDWQVTATDQPADAGQQTHVPDYLRENVRSRRRWTTIVAVGLILLVVLGAWFLASIRDGHLLAGLFSSQPPAQTEEPASTEGKTPAGNGGPEEAGQTPPENSAPPTRNEDATDSRPASTEPKSPPAPSMPPAEAPGTTVSKPKSPDAGPAAQEQPDEKSKAAGPVPAEPAKSRPDAPGPERPVAPANGANEGDGADAAAVPEKPAAKRSANGGGEVGRLATTKQVVLRWNAKSSVWQRLADEAAVNAGDRLIGLPAFRPRLALVGNISLELVDGSSVTALNPDSKGVPGIVVEDGRLLVKALDAKGARLRLQFGDRSGILQLADADTAVAAEVSRMDGAGSDPETQPGSLAADLYVLSGKAEWNDEPAGKQIRLTGPVRLSLGEQALEPVALQQLPKWVAADPGPSLDQRAAVILERELGPGRPVMLGLRELTDDRRREVHLLATRSLSLTGDFGPLLRALEDPDQIRRKYESIYIEQLRAAIYRSPKSAAAVRTAMETRYGPQGASLYEMLWKYPADTLQPEDLNRLVGFLDHDGLPFRVLAFWNLKSIGNNRTTLSYHPEDPPAKRQTAIQKWKERLKATPTPRNPLPTTSNGDISSGSNDAAPPRRDAKR